MIIWSKAAREDLRLIYQYIAHDSKRYAARVVQDIVEKVEVLREVPKLGRKVPEIGEDSVREVSLYSYRVMYELAEDILYIHGIFHRRRNFKPGDLQRKK